MNAQQIENTIIGLKSNVARGFSLADFWSATHAKTSKNLIKCWKMMEDAGMEMDGVIEMAWEEVQSFTHYQTVSSAVIGEFSVIKEMVIKATTYTTKKGITKTKPEERVPSHYTKGGEFIGRVSKLGDKPIAYPIQLQITPKHFQWKGVGVSLTDCFELKDGAVVEAGDDVKVAKVSKADLKTVKAEEHIEELDE